LEFDNSNMDTFSNGTEMIWLPEEKDPLALRRAIWLGMDEAYKDAIDTYSQKSSAWENREYPDRPEMLPLSKRPTIDSQSKSDFDTTWAYDTSIALSSVFKAYPELDSNEVLVYEKSYVEDVLTTEGVHTSEVHHQVIIHAESVTKASDGSRIRDTRSWVVPSREALPSMEELTLELQELAEWTLALRDAPIEDNYLGPVILEDMAAVEVFRQLIHPQLSGTPPTSATPNADGTLPRNIPTARMGRRLLPFGWSVVDDATLDPQLNGSYAYDAQGVSPTRVELVEDGVVKDLLMTRIPRTEFTESTGHARASGGDRYVAFPSVVTVKPKRHTNERKLFKKGVQLAKQTGNDYILVIKYLEPLALSEDFEVAFTGDEQLSGLTTPSVVVRRYVDGREEPVRGLKFVGVDRRVLKDIVLAGPQQDFVGLMDDADGRYFMSPTGGRPVSWSVPSILISEMELSGQGGGDEYILAAPTLD
jgi:TldD protein